MPWLCWPWPRLFCVAATWRIKYKREKKRDDYEIFSRRVGHFQKRYSRPVAPADYYSIDPDTADRLFTGERARSSRLWSQPGGPRDARSWCERAADGADHPQS